jgi:hypothetical protein
MYFGVGEKRKCNGIGRVLDTFIRNEYRLPDESGAVKLKLFSKSRKNLKREKLL